MVYVVTIIPSILSLKKFHMIIICQWIKLLYFQKKPDIIYEKISKNLFKILSKIYFVVFSRFFSKKTIMIVLKIKH